MDIHYYLSQCTSKKIEYSRSGGGNGSILMIKCEENYTFFISCDWRLERHDTVLSTSWDDITAVTGLVARTARLLEGKTILSTELSKQYDLTLTFEEGYCLRVFCMSYSYPEYEELGDYHWEFWLPDEDLSFAIANNFKVRVGKYHSNDD